MEEMKKPHRQEGRPRQDWPSETGRQSQQVRTDPSPPQGASLTARRTGQGLSFQFGQCNAGRACPGSCNRTRRPRGKTAAEMADSNQVTVRLLRSDGVPVGLGVRFAPGLVLTTRYVVQERPPGCLRGCLRSPSHPSDGPGSRGSAVRSLRRREPVAGGVLHRDPKLGFAVLVLTAEEDSQRQSPPLLIAADHFSGPEGPRLRSARGR